MSRLNAILGFLIAFHSILASADVSVFQQKINASFRGRAVLVTTPFDTYTGESITGFLRRDSL